MKKSGLALTTLAIIMIILVSISFGCKIAAANPNYSIETVIHNVEVLYNGYFLINDTLSVSGQVDSFLLGFPHKFGSHVLEAVAYDTNDRSNVYPVSLDTPLEDHVGFYGIRVDLSGRTAQVFRVVLVLSNDLITQDPENTSIFTLDFPAFPSLTETAAVCNSSIVLPQDAQYLKGTVSTLNYSAVNLPPFTYNESDVSFLVANEEMQLFDAKQLDRQMSLNEFGEIAASDSYSISNMGSNNIQSVQIILPSGALNPSSQDQLGRTMSTPTLSSGNPNQYNVSFTLPAEPNKLFSFTVTYDLPGQDHVGAQSASSYVMNMTLFQDVDYYVDEVSVSFLLPEGGHLTGYEDTAIGGTSDLGRSVFQDALTINHQGIYFLESFSIAITYSYNPLWIAFRPTMWIWAVAIVGCAVFAVLRRPKTVKPVSIPSTAMRLQPENIRSFVDAYDEKMKVLAELDSLEVRVQKGRIPRRRYKVQKKTLEMRLNALSRTLTDSRERMRSAGGHYSDLMRQIEVAETEIDDVEANVKSIEARHNRGEVTLETYRERLGDYQRRKEKAKTTINGILLRLREEIR